MKAGKSAWSNGYARTWSPIAKRKRREVKAPASSKQIFGQTILNGGRTVAALFCRKGNRHRALRAVFCGGCGCGCRLDQTAIDYPQEKKDRERDNEEVD